MSTNIERPPGHEAPDALTGGLASSAGDAAADAQAQTLGALPVGARLIVRCRKDWRAATVAAFEAKEDDATTRVVINVASPSGHTYRLRRPHDAPLNYHGHIPLLGEGHWRVGLVRYDVRW